MKLDDKNAPQEVDVKVGLVGNLKGTFMNIPKILKRVVEEYEKEIQARTREKDGDTSV